MSRRPTLLAIGFALVVAQSGVYFLELTAEGQTQRTRMTLVR
ncbi:MAG: hypothetical protein QGH20_02295 [Candidatus Latescibacteria bacterium]|nr:hypothetical protein [Candidatus Latescibacterota bacterium]